MTQTIDMVIPFVDNTDILWRKIYNDYCISHNLKNKLIDINTERYSDNLRLIEYQLKLINKNMPWVNKIYLLLMNREQAPKDLPDNVNIELLTGKTKAREKKKIYERLEKGNIDVAKE